MLLGLRVGQLSQEIVPLHLPSQAKVSALLLQLPDGILERGVKPNSPLEVGLDLLVHLVGALNSGREGVALRLPLSNVEDRDKVRVFLGEVGDEAIL